MIPADRSYFSRLTRERRKQGNESQATLDDSMISFDDNDDDQQQSQEDEDNNDFDSAVSERQARVLLDHATAVLDEILSQQSSSSDSA